MTTKDNYLLDPKFDQNKFYQIRKTMFKEDRIMKDKRGKHNAVLLYSGIEDKINLSKKTHLEKGDSSFMTLNGEYYCVFPVKTAKEELNIERTKYGHHKALLRDARLIHYDPQEIEKEGYASKITYTPWDIWVKQHGLYSDGKWIIPPSIDDYYNPTDIVTVQPTITPIIHDEVQTPVEEHVASEPQQITKKPSYLDGMPDMPFEELKPKSRPTIYVEPESPKAQTIRTTLRKRNKVEY
ncbi:hypothetical protein [Bacillus mycoides]|uniref:hypothetical protein n=1 Tax=Bacillus mycoides TaxID=1405 RepID=UPI000B4C17C5|nr:hypothetical protein [Bacillus mycoides]